MKNFENSVKQAKKGNGRGGRVRARISGGRPLCADSIFGSSVLPCVVVVLCVAFSASPCQAFFLRNNNSWKRIKLHSPCDVSSIEKLPLVSQVLEPSVLETETIFPTIAEISSAGMGENFTAIVNRQNSGIEEVETAVSNEARSAKVREGKTGSTTFVRGGATERVFDESGLSIVVQDDEAKNELLPYEAFTESARSTADRIASTVHDTVLDLMERQMNQYLNCKDSLIPVSFEKAQNEEVSRKPVLLPREGTILVQASPNKSNLKTTVRVATPMDDIEVAHLRLSVFSDFSPEIRQQFCSRSCRAMSSRRMHGATCVVATVPRAGKVEGRPSIVVGSAECSFHEFFGTRLGYQRPNDSLLYITEVAVSPRARRRGIGEKLLKAIDELAAIRCTETLYLHVDVENYAAIALYEKAGYRRTSAADPTFLEFTKSLNLHDGATKGRKHYLMYKDLTSSPTWLPVEDTVESVCVPSQQVGVLGFDV